jgi:hypothetical protein
MAGIANEQDKTELIKEVQSRNLLTDQEAEVVTKCEGCAVAPLMWMFSTFEKNIHTVHAETGCDVKVNKIEDKILVMSAGIINTLTAVSSYGLTPLPLVHLMSALVKIVSELDKI